MKFPREGSLSNELTPYRALPKGSVPGRVSISALMPSLETGGGEGLATNLTGFVTAMGAMAIHAVSPPRHDATAPVFGFFQLSAPWRSMSENVMTLAGLFTKRLLFFGSFTPEPPVAVKLVIVW